MKSYCVYFCSLMVGIICMPLQEVSAEPVSLTLKEAIGLALKQNHNLQISKLKIIEQQAVTQQTLSGYLPQLSLQATQSRQLINYSATGIGEAGTFVPTSATYNAFDGHLQLSQVVFNASLLKSIQISKQQEKSSKSDYSNTREATTLQTISLYLQALQAETRVIAAQARVDSSKALLDQALKFEDAGTGSQLESARANQSYQNERQIYSEDSVSFETAKLTLLQFINLVQSQEIILKDRAGFEKVQPISIDSSLLIALNNRKDLQSARIQERALELNIDKTRLQRLPTVSVSGQLGRTGTDPFNTDNAYFIGATVTAPLFTGWNITGQVKQAQVQLAEQRETTKQLETQIELEIRSAVVALNAAENQVISARDGVTSAFTTLRLTRSRYDAGIDTNVDVVISQNDLARAQENEIRALYTYNIAKANLAHATGVIQELYVPELAAELE